MLDESIINAGNDGTAQPNFFKAVPIASLEQGDLIVRRSEVVTGPLSTYHRYHVENPANEMFAVLTQSCDLVRHGGNCKVRYITLAPVRSLRSVLAREFADELVHTPGNLYALGSSVTEYRYNDFLRKIINNNDSRHFFIPKNLQLGIGEDLCIMLPLGLPIRSEHYDSCIAGRSAQLDDLFQAKLGWLLGQQYSRVGTPDWPQSIVDEKTQAVTNQILSWLPENDFGQIKRLVQVFQNENPGKVVDEGEMISLMRKVKNRKELAIDTLFTLLSDLIPPEGKERFALRKKMRQDPEFAKFFPGS